MSDGLPLHERQEASGRKPPAPLADADEEIAERFKAASHFKENLQSPSAAFTVAGDKKRTQLGEILKLPEKDDISTSANRREIVEKNGTPEAEHFSSTKRNGDMHRGKNDASDAVPEKRSQYEDIVKRGLLPQENVAAPERSTEAGSGEKAVANAQENAPARNAAGESGVSSRQPSEPNREQAFKPPFIPPPGDPPVAEMHGKRSRSNDAEARENLKRNVSKNEAVEERTAQEEVTQVFQVRGSGNSDGLVARANSEGGGALDRFEKRNDVQVGLSDDISRIHGVDTKQLVPDAQAKGNKILRDPFSVRDNDPDWRVADVDALQQGAMVALKFISPKFIQQRKSESISEETQSISAAQGEHERPIGPRGGGSPPQAEGKGQASEIKTGAPEISHQKIDAETARANDRIVESNVFRGIKRASVSELGEQLMQRRRVESIEVVKEIGKENWKVQGSPEASLAAKQQAAAVNKLLSVLEKGERNGYQLSPEMVNTFRSMVPAVQDAICRAYPKASLQPANAWETLNNAQDGKNLRPAMADASAKALNARSAEVKALNAAQRGLVIGKAKGAGGATMHAKQVVRAQKRSGPYARSPQRSVAASRGGR